MCWLASVLPSHSRTINSLQQTNLGFGLPCPCPAARFKLAQLVQYLPLPVIGGYLSFVGESAQLSKALPELNRLAAPMANPAVGRPSRSLLLPTLLHHPSRSINLLQAISVSPVVLGWASARTSAPLQGEAPYLQRPACAAFNAPSRLSTWHSSPCQPLAFSPAPPYPPALPACSWVNLFNKDALVKFVPTVLSCLAMIFTLEHFAHPLALPAGKSSSMALWAWHCAVLSCHPATIANWPRVGQLPIQTATLVRRLHSRSRPTQRLPPAALPVPAVLAAINVAFHLGRLVLGVTLEQAMDAKWVIRPAVSGEGEERKHREGQRMPARPTAAPAGDSVAVEEPVWLWCVHGGVDPELAPPLDRGRDA